MKNDSSRPCFDRRLFTGLSLSAGITFISQQASAQVSDRVEILETNVISEYSTAYCGWPTLIKTAAGDLLVVYSGGRQSHVCPFGRVEMIRSADDGKTWTFPRVIMDGPIDDRDAGLCETAKGSLLATTFTSTAYVPLLEKRTGAELQRWLAVHNRLDDEQRDRELGCWFIRSVDGGVTWSERYRSLVDSPHGPTTLSDGRILYAGVGLWDAERPVGVAESTDDGVSWRWLADIPNRPGDDRKQYHELHLAECKSGKLLAHIRNHNPQNNRETLQSESTDGGKSWTLPRAIGVWGLPSHLLQLDDGRLAMTYGYRRKPFGNQVRISEDEGQNWGEPLTISADGIGSDLGYPSSVQLPDGEFYSVWYERLADNPYAVLRGARWNSPTYRTCRFTARSQENWAEPDRRSMLRNT